MHAGDAVKYVPDRVHARQKDREGNFPWVFGWKTGKRVKDDHGQFIDEVVELTDGETERKLQHISKQAPDRANREADRLVFLRPSRLWDAVVVAYDEVNEQADLDIFDPTTGATLHYCQVPVDPAGKQPHTCHAKD